MGGTGIIPFRWGIPHIQERKVWVFSGFLRLSYQAQIDVVVHRNSMGHLVTDKGLKPDPEKIIAVTNMPTPDSVSVVRRFCGFVIT